MSPDSTPPTAPGPEHSARPARSGRGPADPADADPVHTDPSLLPAPVPWVDERLTRLDRAVLASLDTLHVATTRHLERLHLHPATSPPAAARRTRRCTTRLEHLGLVERLGRRVGGPRAGSVAHGWRLTPTGAHIAGRSHRGRTSAEPSIAHVRHVLEVTELVVRLHEAARRPDSADLLTIETEPACWRTYTDRRARTRRLKPDLRLTLGTDDRELHWFVEMDRATERRPVLAAKAAAYVAAWRHGSEQARCGTFPRVLWIVPHARRAITLQQVCKATAGAPAGLFHVAEWGDAVAALTTSGMAS